MSRVFAALVLLLAIAVPARAQVARTFTPRFNVQTAGDVTLIGNTVMSCSATDSKCANAQAGGGTGNVDNEDFTMQYVDVDGDATTFSSSTATLSLPSGATVLFAGLYWGGYSALAARNTVKLAVPGGAYATVTAQQLDAIGSAYQGFLDVTAQVKAAGSGTYRVANVQSTPGTNDVWGGWSIVVAYHLDTAIARNLTVADGYVFAGPGNPVNLSVTGFLTPPSGTVQAGVGIVAYDGDPGHTGEDLILNSTTLSDALNPVNNVFNSTITLEGTRFSAKSPDYANQLGFDADILSANGVLGNGTTSATVTLQSASDRYYAGGIVFKTQIFVPKFDAGSFRKTVVDLNGGSVRPGDVLEYTIMARNVGTDAALQTVLRDTLAATLTFVAGSLRVTAGANGGAKTDAAGDDQMEYVAATRTIVARVGTGADAANGGRLDVNASSTIVFRAQVTSPAPTGTAVANQAALACIGAQLGQPQSAVSDGDSTVAGEQRTIVTTVSSPITGTVFEDQAYGGGAGRSRVVSGGAVAPGARVELYDASGNYKTFATTDASGLYSFDGWAPALYTVRVVNATVASGRPGSVAGLLPVQTFRTDATSGTAVAVADRVGGETPSLADAAANTSNASLGSLTTATTTAQSVSPVTLGTSTVDRRGFRLQLRHHRQRQRRRPGKPAAVHHQCRRAHEWLAGAGRVRVRGRERAVHGQRRRGPCGRARGPCEPAHGRRRAHHAWQPAAADHRPVHAHRRRHADHERRQHEPGAPGRRRHRGRGRAHHRGGRGPRGGAARQRGRFGGPGPPGHGPRRGQRHAALVRHRGGERRERAGARGRHRGPRAARPAGAGRHRDVVHRSGCRAALARGPGARARRRTTACCATACSASAPAARWRSPTPPTAGRWTAARCSGTRSGTPRSPSSRSRRAVRSPPRARWCRRARARASMRPRPRAASRSRTSRFARTAAGRRGPPPARGWGVVAVRWRAASSSRTTVPARSSSPPPRRGR
jgi:uncharacterized repeat protein (TIGR01451 family)